MATQRPAGLVPVGCVVAYLKSLTNAPALPDEFVECNGQTLSDAQSVFNGVVIPDLNGITGGTPVKRFLRGSSTSGTTGGTETHSHNLITLVPCYSAGTCYVIGLCCGVTCSSATLPSYYEVVWVMRIK